jgi:hypothetical protein
MSAINFFMIVESGGGADRNGDGDNGTDRTVFQLTTINQYINKPINQ